METGPELAAGRSGVGRDQHRAVTDDQPRANSSSWKRVPDPELP